MHCISPKLVVFDLDGTLTDSSETIYRSTHRTFRELGMDNIIEKPQLDSRIGAHFQEIFDDLHIDVGNLEDFIHIYKGFYFDYLPETSLYEGVEDVLLYLKRKNSKTALLTTKAQDQAEKILRAFKLDMYFDLIMGRRPGIAVKPSAEPLQYIMRELLVIPEETLMVGDSELDIRCGKNAGAKTVAVTYGYRTEELLRKEQPDFLITRITELNEIIK
ncbi:MAG: HAD-IA family hydrolase [Ignavibacteriaceae bacterium]|nr:HAD-IA family hydrolase [Ignavibacteriaceae bacterium]